MWAEKREKDEEKLKAIIMMMEVEENYLMLNVCFA